MGLKIGAGGKPQPYDFKGRYCSFNIKNFITPFKLSKKATSLIKENSRFNKLREKAIKKGDPDLLKVVDFLANNCFKSTRSIFNVNAFYLPDGSKKFREFDIITEKCIIEVKRSPKPGCLEQCTAQQEFSNKYKKGKPVVVYDELIRFNAKKDLENHNFRVFTNLKDLEKYIKEN